MSDLETAWKTFETRDVLAVDVLCLRWAALDGARFVALQKKAASGKPESRRKAAAELLAMVADLPTPELFDGVLSSVAMDRGDRDEALALKLRALALTPRWHPVLAARVVGNVGWTLQAMGRLDEAVVWFERASTFDPVNPYVLGSLAEIRAHRGDRDGAAALRRWLARTGCPVALCADVDAVLGAIPEAGPVHAPDLAGLHSLDMRGWGRLVATCLADDQTPIPRRIRAMAIGAAMRGEVGMARLLIAEAEETCDPEIGGAEVDPVERAWITATDRWLAASGIAAAPADGQARAGMFDAAMAVGDRATIVRHLCDPVAPFRVMAAEMLGDEEGRAWLEEVAAVEARDGRSAAAPSSDPASAALHRLRVRQVGPRPAAVIPPDGRLATSTKLGKREAVVAWATFPGLPTPEEQVWFDERLRAVAGEVAEEEPDAQILTDGLANTLQIMFQKVKAPARVAAALVEHLGGEGSLLRDLVIGRYEVPDGKKHHLFHPTADPGAPERDVAAEARFAAAFDPDAAPPRTEPEDGPSMIMIPSPQGHVPEVRLPSLRQPDVRVVYGLENVEDRPGDDAVAAFGAALDAALHETFRGVPPERFDEKGETNGRPDAIAHAGRKGYAVALHGLCPEMVVHHPTSFRFREWELLAAFRLVVMRLGLAPVIQWERAEGTWIVNVWERA